jgi:putative transposase
MRMQLTHKIALCPTPAQIDYFKRAGGTARRVWNWALNEWNKQYAAGGKPNAMALKKQFNAIKYTDPKWLDENGRPWLRDIHRDAHAQPFAHLAKAWARFFADLKAGKQAHPPRFKKKGRCRDSFYVANDKFRLDGKTIRLPKIGEVAITEELRFEGKILGATVSRTADRWFVAIEVEVPDAQFYRRRTSHEVSGVDLGIKAAVTISNGKVIEAPKLLKAALRRLEIRSRRLSRKLPKRWRGLDAMPACPKERACRFRTTGRSPLRHWQGSLPVLPISERTLLISSRLDSAAKTKR